MNFIDQDNPIILVDIQDKGHDMEAYNVPVRFRVGSVEFFGSDEEPYMELEVADVAPRMMACLRTAQQYGRSALNLRLFGYGYAIVFVRDGVDILIGVPDPNSPIGTRARYTTLFTAWMEFAVKVRDTAIQQHPEVAARPWWSLITGDAPEDFAEALERTLTRPDYFHRLDLCFPQP